MEKGNGDSDSLSCVAALAGTWVFELPDLEGARAIIQFVDAERSVQFVFNLKGASERVVFRFRYSVVSTNQLRFRLSPDSEGWLNECVFEEGGVWLIRGENRCWLTRPAREQIPEWFHEALASELAKY